jgi:exodeoxyribonuclease VIII
MIENETETCQEMGIVDTTCIAENVNEIDYEKRCFWRMSDEVYNAADGLRHSKLSRIFPPNTPLDFKFAEDMHREIKSTALSFGTASHLAVFQPEEFERRIAVAPDVKKTTKAGKEEFAAFEAECVGKTIISAKEKDDCFYMRDAIYRHPIGNMLSGKKGEAELTGFFKWGDTLCKFRADYLVRSHNVVFDLKTTNAGHSSAFLKSILEYNYHTQCLFYLTGASQVTGRPFDNWIWLVVEKHSPYKIYLYQPEREWLVYAEKVIHKAIGDIERGRSSNDWPGPSSVLQTLFVPKWMKESLFV